MSAVTGRGSDTLAQAAVEAVRREVRSLHAELVRWGLVAWTSGNVSARVPRTGLMVIKPSGVEYDELTEQSIVVCDLDGVPAADWQDGGHRPSSDTKSHAYIYRHMPGVGAVVHTHSAYATAWAACGLPIPCVLTAIADEFGGDIPVGSFAPIGGDEIGRAVVQTLSQHRSPAVLMASHGVFAIGPTAREAVKAAVMCEDAARTVYLARQLGEPARLTGAQVDALHSRYVHEYGQQPREEIILPAAETGVRLKPEPGRL